MANSDIASMAHLMRRAGFGASYEELERLTAQGYAATVEELLNPEAQPDIPLDLIHRYVPEWRGLSGLPANQIYWTYRMINSPRPLQEKICLFWHGIFCVGYTKCHHGRQQQIQLEMFRQYGLDRLPDLLSKLASDPAMIFYLDNQMSHKNAVNENWGRELLELFSMGVGMEGQPNYTEEDVKSCARAFTGWTIGNAVTRYPYDYYENLFLYNSADHDDGEKTFLGETGRWNGGDIIEIIAKQPATARFIARHLYNFFVADEPSVPSWLNTPPRDPEAIKTLEDEYFRSNYDIRAVLRALFNSEFFKNARFAKVKSPAEAVAGTLRLVGDQKFPKPDLVNSVQEMTYMGQALMNPPTVEGWHTGLGWIDSGTLVERINFTTEQLGRTDTPGIRAIVDRLNSNSLALSSEQFVDGCLELLGCYALVEETRCEIIAHVDRSRESKTDSEGFAQLTGEVLQLIASTQEYQFA